MLAALIGIAGMSFLLASRNVVAVAITAPYSTVPVADADLDGNPATGAWSDALSSAIPLENGDATYGGATLYAKHDGTTSYFRIDGTIDVPWTSAAANHFWLGMVISDTGTSHHGTGTWDGVFFGVWDGKDYTPQPAYPPAAVDTNGYAKPPARDIAQDALGRMRYTGAAAPYGFTAEWKRPLASGDLEDLAYADDGATAYNFFVTTDSDGGGSSGGNVGHHKVTNANTIRFAVPSAPNTPPTADLTNPDGGATWSGGSSHIVWWNMTDAETAIASLKVWLNYSTDGGATFSPIAAVQGTTGFSNPASYAWTVPGTNTVQARVRVTVADAGGLTATDASLANFAVDATPPTASAFNPPDGATGVSPTTAVRVTFSEPMNAASAEQAFSLRRTDTGAYVSGAFSWLANDLVYTPSAALSQGIVHRAQVNATARDVSDPGNALGAVATASFTTADVSPPSITGASALPSPQEAGGSVNVSAAVTDNGMVGAVHVEVRDAGGGLLGNFTASFDSGSGRYFHAAAYATPGTYTYRVAAVDAAGNWATVTGSFVIVDTRPPVIAHTPVTTAVRNMPIPLSAVVSDVDAVADVRVDYTDVLGTPFNVSMARNGTTYDYAIPGQPQVGLLTYFIWARDPSGNAARTPTYTVTVVGSDATPPQIANATATPSVQEPGFAVNITAIVTDNTALRDVTVVVTDPLGQVLGNVTMARLGVTDTFYFERTYVTLGTYGGVLWAADTSDNNATASVTFRIVDRLAPVFQSVTATPPTQEAGGRVNITAIVTDNVGVASVRARILDPSGGVALDAVIPGASGAYWTEAAYAVLGTYDYTLFATDAAGNAANATGTFTIVDTTVPVAVAGPDVRVWIGTTVTFDGSGSTDNVGIVNYTWSFTVNGTAVLLYGPAPRYRFDIVGSFPVLLTVVDVAGLSGADSMTVDVVTDTAPPAPPAGLLVQPQGPDCLRLSWSPSNATDLSGYGVYRWNETAQRFDLVADVGASTITYEDCGLADDTVYRYWVVARDSTGNVSPPSEITTGRTLSALATVEDLHPILGIIVGLVVLVLILVAAAWFRRRSKPEAPGQTEPPRGAR